MAKRKRKRVCSARCRAAQTDDRRCRCVCGGKDHGRDGYRRRQPVLFDNNAKGVEGA
jgi:hypothetical protein